MLGMEDRVCPDNLEKDQLKRYNRHILLPNVGEIGQRKLLDASVFINGVGGLGSPCSMYLAAAGVGKIGLADFDTVDLSNLQRQIIHHGHDISRPKVASAAETIADINPDVEIEQFQVKLTSENVMGGLFPPTTLLSIVATISPHVT